MTDKELKCNERMKLTPEALQAQDDLLDDALCPFCGSGNIEEVNPNVYVCHNCKDWYEYEYEGE